MQSIKLKVREALLDHSRKQDILVEVPFEHWELEALGKEMLSERFRIETPLDIWFDDDEIGSAFVRFPDYEAGMMEEDMVDRLSEGGFNPEEWYQNMEFLLRNLFLVPYSRTVCAYAADPDRTTISVYLSLQDFLNNINPALVQKEVALSTTPRLKAGACSSDTAGPG